jgi:DNA-binding winged helix-turn-helix (wHTH) protein
MDSELDLLRVGRFELDPRSRELRTGSTCLRLQEQPFEVLRMMLERPGRVVTRDELRQRLWPAGTFVDFEHSLNAAVKRLRAALGDDADNPRFIETVPRRGYRFVGDQDETPGTESGDTPHRVRLAVLPFVDLGEEAGRGGRASRACRRAAASCRAPRAPTPSRDAGRQR